MQLISIRIQLETNIKGDETSRTEAHDCPAGAFREAPLSNPKSRAVARGHATHPE
jgi:hypothetical protein